MNRKRGSVAVSGQHHRIARAAASAVALALCVVLVLPPDGFAWFGDHFDGHASGQAVYESAAIHPQAVHAEDGNTYVVYQGAGMHPHIVRVDDRGRWEGPVKIADNPLTTTVREPDATH